MSQIIKFYKDSKGVFANFYNDYTNHLNDLIRETDIKAAEKLVNFLLEARERGATIFIIGNGGSASTASHLAEDLALCAGGGEDKPFRALSLCDSVPYISALGNDEAYENVFTGQLRNLYRRGDVLIAISASGNSKNLINAIDYVNSKGGETFGLIGFDGGEAKKKCTHHITISTHKGHYGPVESMHLLLIHVVSNYIFFHLNHQNKRS